MKAGVCNGPQNDRVIRGLWEAVPQSEQIYKYFTTAKVPVGCRHFGSDSVTSGRVLTGISVRNRAHRFTLRPFHRSIG